MSSLLVCGKNKRVTNLLSAFGQLKEINITAILGDMRSLSLVPLFMCLLSCTNYVSHKEAVARAVEQQSVKCALGTPEEGYFRVKKGSSIWKSAAKKDKLAHEINIPNIKPYNWRPDETYAFRSLCRKDQWIQAEMIKMEHRDVSGTIGWIYQNDIYEVMKVRPAKNFPAANVDQCKVKGERWLRLVEAWPIMSDGADAAAFVERRCINLKSAFDSAD